MKKTMRATTKTNRFSLVADATLDRRLFLAQALAHGDTLGGISREQADTLYQNIAAIAHKLITMKTSDLSDESALRTQIQICIHAYQPRIRIRQQGRSRQSGSAAL